MSMWQYKALALRGLRLGKKAMARKGDILKFAKSPMGASAVVGGVLGGAAQFDRYSQDPDVDAMTHVRKTLGGVGHGALVGAAAGTLAFPKDRFSKKAIQGAMRYGRKFKELDRTNPIMATSSAGAALGGIAQFSNLGRSEDDHLYGFRRARRTVGGIVQGGLSGATFGTIRKAMRS